MQICRHKDIPIHTHHILWCHKYSTCTDTFTHVLAWQKSASFTYWYTVIHTYRQTDTRTPNPTVPSTRLAHLHTYVCDRREPRARTHIDTQTYRQTHTHTYYIRQYHQNDYGLQQDHLHVWQDSFISATRLMHMCNMTHSRSWLWSTTVSSIVGVWHDPFLCVSWLIHTCDMTQSISIDDYALQ